MGLNITPEQRREVADRVRSEAGQRSEMLREEMGDRLFDLLEENFPEEYAARRRRDGARAFVAGVAVGLIGRELLRRR
ncbi:hypothetical protein HUG10_17075 [Halorarum halophilum]|uniref:Uncharacterized protein n=1 Tax=Halorarum halophilum TaxID=2743090 RepID=A0A7D5KFN8_9EURY|nr:hypothetical protein [Halobaculum halophilum]QLG29137.1 hypothetical protein HUG10_17075 [Halobaculum halophilum]